MKRPSYSLRLPAVSVVAAVPALAGILLAGILLPGCAELKDKVPAPTSPAISVHAEGWTVPASAQFHGKEISADDWDMGSCKSCHGADYSGGTATFRARPAIRMPAGGKLRHLPRRTELRLPGDLSGNSASSPGGGPRETRIGQRPRVESGAECHNVRRPSMPRGT